MEKGNGRFIFRVCLVVDDSNRVEKRIFVILLTCVVDGICVCWFGFCVALPIVPCLTFVFWRCVAVVD